MASHHHNTPTVAILDQVTNAYGILNFPNQDSGDPYVQIYGRCHLETKEEIATIQQRLGTLENASIVVPVPSPKGSLDTESHSSTIEDVHHELGEMDERLKEFEETTTRRLTDVEDLVNEVKDAVHDQFNRLSNDIDEAETRVTERADELEKHMDESFVEVGKRVDELEKHMDESFVEVGKKFGEVDKRFEAVDKRFDAVDMRFDAVDMRFEAVDKRFDTLEENLELKFNSKIQYLQDSWESQRKNEQAYRENNIADRLFENVKLLGVQYKDTEGLVFYRFPPPRRPRSVGYYWKMHEPRNHYKLKALHEFYEIPFTNWIRSDNINEYDSSDDESLDPPKEPSTRSEAIAKYPDRAVRALFMRLGLIYSKFEEQAEKLDAMEQESGKGAEKRAATTRALPLAPKTKVRRRNPSWGSTTESLPRSSTQSQE